MLLNEGRICECAVKRGFTEPAHGALAAAVDRKTSADTLAPALTSHSHIDDQAVSFAHLIHPGHQWCVRCGDLE